MTLAKSVVVAVCLAIVVASCGACSFRAAPEVHPPAGLVATVRPTSADPGYLIKLQWASTQFNTIAPGGLTSAACAIPLDRPLTQDCVDFLGSIVVNVQSLRPAIAGKRDSSANRAVLSEVDAVLEAWNALLSTCLADRDEGVNAECGTRASRVLNAYPSVQIKLDGIEDA